jgi:hypothetical protein
MGWIFSAFFVASLVHMGEEYFYPGGFMDFMKRMNPAFAAHVTVPMAIIVNGLQLVLCIVVMIIEEKALTFSMSVAGLLFLNGLIHVGGCTRNKGYAPGVISAVLLYLPLSVFSYYHYITAGQLSWNGVIVSGVLAILFQLVPIAYFGLAILLKRE